MSKYLQWDSARKGWRFEVFGETSGAYFAASKCDAGVMYTLYRQRSGNQRDQSGLGWPWNRPAYARVRRQVERLPMEIHSQFSTGKGGAYEIVRESVEVDGKTYTRTWKRIRPGGPLARRLRELREKRAKCGEVA